MIYGGKASSRPEPKIEILRRHLLCGPAMLDPIAIVSVPGRTLYECRARPITSTRPAAPGIHLLRSRCHLNSDTHCNGAAASPFTDRCQQTGDTQNARAAIHLSRRRAKCLMIPKHDAPAATHTQGDKND